MDTEANESWFEASFFESSYNPQHDLVELVRSHKLCIWLSAHRACHFKTNLTNHCTTSTTNCIITARTLSLLSHTKYSFVQHCHISLLNSSTSGFLVRCLFLQTDCNPTIFDCSIFIRVMPRQTRRGCKTVTERTAFFYDKKTQSGPCILKCGKFFI